MFLKLDNEQGLLCNFPKSGMEDSGGELALNMKYDIFRSIVLFKNKTFDTFW